MERAYCAPGTETQWAVDMAIAGEQANPEPHPWLAGYEGCLIITDGYGFRLGAGEWADVASNPSPSA